MPVTLDKPIFIMAAPRSGSTLLFETLAVSTELWTVGGESHNIFESIPELGLGAQGVTSNRLTEKHATSPVATTLINNFLNELRDSEGNMLHGSSHSGAIRMLEKTPKNSLRIPFIEKIFPDAFYIYLYRDPLENISSIMESWRAGRWVTYNSLPGWEGSWSLLLPPNWAQMRGKSLAEIAAFQWERANRYILNDLKKIPANRWMAINYSDLLSSTEKEIRRICTFAQAKFDTKLEERTTGRLPYSRYTLTAPVKEKWRKNEREVLPVLPSVLPTLNRATEAAKNHSIPEDDTATPISKIGRNSPCPCGSNKKYKRCHGRP